MFLKKFLKPLSKPGHSDNTIQLIIIGLGNPGRDYHKTRHNIGFMALDYFAKKHRIKLAKRERFSLIGWGEINLSTVMLVRPRTYMNLSGKAVHQIISKYKTSPEKIVVIHDDLDLKPGQIRLRFGGGSAGHKGINSITSCLGTRDFMRLKIGIGRPDQQSGESGIVDYVLGELTPEETRLADQVLPQVSEALESIIEEGMDVAMSRFNRSFTPPQS